MNNDENKIKASTSDYLANERTFLAWLRTGTALMGLGFVVVRFSLFVNQLSLAATGHPGTPVKEFSGTIGICFVAIGAFTGLLGYMRYKRVEQQLLNQAFHPSSKLILIITACIICGSLLLLYYLLPNMSLSVPVCGK